MMLNAAGPSDFAILQLCDRRVRFARRRAGGGKPAFALMAERGAGRCVGSSFITLNRELREALEARPGPRRHGAEGNEATGNAMGEAGADRPV